MKTKAKEKYIKWIASIGFVLILVVGAIVGSLLNKDKEVDLKITAENISVLVGDSKPLKYQSSVKTAEIRFRVQNTKIADVEEENVFGKAVGVTELIITARYKSLVYEKRVDVTVLNKEENPSEPDNKNEENEGDGNKEDAVLPDKEELAVEVFKIAGCTVTGKTIEMMVAKTARIQLLFEEEYSTIDLVSNDELLIVKEAEEGQRVFLLSATANGNYEVLVKIGNKETKLVVIVKE